MQGTCLPIAIEVCVIEDWEDCGRLKAGQQAGQIPSVRLDERMPIQSPLTSRLRENSHKNGQVYSEGRPQKLLLKARKS